MRLSIEVTHEQPIGDSGGIQDTAWREVPVVVSATIYRRDGEPVVEDVTEDPPGYLTAHERDNAEDSLWQMFEEGEADLKSRLEAQREDAAEAKREGERRYFERLSEEVAR